MTLDAHMRPYSYMYYAPHRDRVLQLSSPFLRHKSAVRCSGRGILVLERESSFSLDFWPFGPLVLDGARSKVDLHGEGYAWTPIGGVPTTPRGRDPFLLCLFFG